MGGILCLVLLWLGALQLSRAVTCYAPPGAVLPLQDHCDELVTALLEISHLPSQKVIKSWGRDLPNGPTTMRLPKRYYIAGAGPRTCGVEIDNYALAPHAVEVFGLVDIAHASQQIFELCLTRRSEVGLNRIGAGKNVEVKLVRIDKEQVLHTIVGTLQEIVIGQGRVLSNVDLNATSLIPPRPLIGNF